MTRKTVTIKVVGRLWLPMCKAAMTLRVSSSKGDTLESFEDYMLTHTGDLSTILDYQIEYSLTRSRPGTLSGESILHSRERIARPWTNQDSECEHIDLMYPSEDD